MKKIVTALFLVGSLLGFSGVLCAKKNKGEELLIQKKDGQEVGGELIAVKERSLLLMDSRSGADMSVLFGDIHVLKIVKKSNVMKGALNGLAIGGVIGGVVVGSALSSGSSSWGKLEAAGAVTIGLGLCVVGALIGAATAAATDQGIDYDFEALSEPEIDEILFELREKARMPDYN